MNDERIDSIRVLQDGDTTMNDDITLAELDGDDEMSVKRQRVDDGVHTKIEEEDVFKTPKKPLRPVCHHTYTCLTPTVFSSMDAYCDWQYACTTFNQTRSTMSVG